LGLGLGLGLGFYSALIQKAAPASLLNQLNSSQSRYWQKA
jgi:hypothetical protein